MALYRIAGLYVKMEPRFKTLVSQSEAYLTNENHAPDIDLMIPPERIKAYNDVYPYLSEDDAEYIFYGGAFYSKLIPFGGFMLHSSALAYEGNAYLFSANSGVGKSTHTSMWQKAFGEGVRIINDDKPAIRLIDGVPTVFGTPFSGKTDKNLNISVPLKAIACISRAEVPEIRPMSPEKYVPFLLGQMIRPAAKADMLLGLLDGVLKKTPVYDLKCNISTDSAIVAYNTMKG